MMEHRIDQAMHGSVNLLRGPHLTECFLETVILDLANPSAPREPLVILSANRTERAAEKDRAATEARRASLQAR